MSKKELKNKAASKKEEDLKLQEISKHQNRGVISFTKDEDEKALAVNPIRFLLSLYYSKAPSREEKLEIDYKEKDEPNKKDFEIIMEVNPSNFEDDKKKRFKKKNNLPMLYDKEKIEEETMGIIDDYADIFTRQMKLMMDFSEIYVKSISSVQKSFLEEYFKLFDDFSKK